MFWIVYRFFIVLFELAIRIHSIWDRGSQHFLSGRRNQHIRLNNWLNGNQEPLIQIHCASLGEFELSLPLYEKLKHKHPKHKFLFTFFSPSGFQHAKIPTGCEKAYLPIDRSKKVKSFLALTKPVLVIFIKYDQYLKQLNKQNIAFGYVNTNQQEHPFNLKFNATKNILNKAAFIFSSNEKTAKDMIANGIRVDANYLDLRYTKSKQILQEKYKPNPGFKKFFTDGRVIICGSVWKEDIEILRPIIKRKKNINWVIAPHQVDPPTLDRIKNLFEPVCVYSEGQMNLDNNVLLIDTIGDLKYLYRFGILNYVGGAFKTGLHNVLEPISTGAPVVFGPEYKAYPEAAQLIKQGLAHSISNSEELATIIEKLEKGSINLNSTEWLNELDSNLEEMTQQIGLNL